MKEQHIITTAFCKRHRLVVMYILIQRLLIKEAVLPTLPMLYISFKFV